MADRLPPSPTELIYLPESSWLPLFTALGVALTVLGLFAWWPYGVIGAIIAGVSIIAWIRRVSNETARLPIEQRSSLAVLPAAPLRRPRAGE